MKRLTHLVAGLVLFAGIAAHAQTTTINATALKMGGNLITAGTIALTGVDVNGDPIVFSDGNGAQNGPVPFNCQVMNGAIGSAIQSNGTVSGTCSVPDSTETIPANILYSAKICDTSSGLTNSGKCYTVQSIVGISGTSFALDHYAPAAQTTNSQPIQYSQGTFVPDTCVSPNIFTNIATNVTYNCINGVYVEMSGGSSGGISGVSIGTPSALTAIGGAASALTAAAVGADAAGTALARTGPCIEDWLTPAMNGDYSQAANALIAATPSTSPRNRVTQCSNAVEVFNSPIISTKPLDFSAYGGMMELGPGLSSPEVDISSCTFTQGSTAVTGCSSTTGLVNNMNVGFYGGDSGNFIVPGSITSTGFTLKRPAYIKFKGMVTAGNTTVTGINHFQDLPTGAFALAANTQIGTAAGVTATVNTANNTALLSVAPTVTSLSPTSFILNPGQTYTSPVYAETYTYLINLVYGTQSFHNNELQQVQSRLRGLTIYDPAALVQGVPASGSTTNYQGGVGRSLRGVGAILAQGDIVDIEDVTIAGVNGPALTMGGGNGPTAAFTTSPTFREGHVSHLQVRDSGNGLTGMGCVNLQTGGAIDEVNTVTFESPRIVDCDGESVTYISMNPANYHQPSGPRLTTWIDPQVELGKHPTSANIPARHDAIHLYESNDFKYIGGEVGAAGFGMDLVDIEAAGGVHFTDVLMYPTGKSATYQVSVQNGSSTVHYISGGNGAFDATTGQWDGEYAPLNDGTTTQATFIARGGVTSSTTATLTAPYTGSATTASMTVGYGGYYIEMTSKATGALFDSIAGTYGDDDATTLSVLGVTAAQTWKTGAGFYASSPVGGEDNYGNCCHLSSLTLGAPMPNAGSASSIGAALYANCLITSGPCASLHLPNLGVAAPGGLTITKDANTLDGANFNFVYNGPSSTTNEVQLAVSGGTGSLLLDAIGNMSAHTLKGYQIFGGGQVPTVTAGAASGTSPTIAITGTDLAGIVTLTTGTATTGLTNGTVFTVTFYGSPLTTASAGCTVSPVGNSGAGAGQNTAAIMNDVWAGPAGISTFSLYNGATALAASTAYAWHYVCI